MKKSWRDTVDMEVVNRLIVFLNGHYPGAYPEDKMTEFLTPFIGREEALLQLTMLLYQNGEEDIAEIVNIMNAFPAGKEDEIHAYVHTQLKLKKELDAAAAAAAIPTQPSVATSGEVRVKPVFLDHVAEVHDTSR
jgi:thioredoxin-like negative regulator of GroEL